ncbi:MAG TPA: M55 family metallopeptidase [Candidatus Limnocylindrales bacterium]|nr:M55 family metallopeptidase [Candidatus Limnocylindrales bacterium]
MRLYLSVDMEGVAGVAHPAQTYFDREGVTDRTDYDRSRGLMAAEANAAIAAAYDAGADAVIVNDSHWQMRNLRAEDLDPRARLIIGDKPFSMTQGIGAEGDGSGFGAAAFIGYHAGAGHPSGVIGHTYASVVMEARVNGVPHNESGLNALRLGHHEVPVILVSGDDALAGEIEQLLPWAERVVVKRAQAALVADMLSPDAARSAIADGITTAIGRLEQMPPYRLPGPLRLEVDLRLPIMADYCAVIPTVERIGPRSVAVQPADAEALYAAFLAIVRMALVPG